MARKLITYSDLKAKKGITFTNKHLRTLEERGRFPKRIRLGAYSNAWDEAEIDAYIEQKFADRDAQRAA